MDSFKNFRRDKVVPADFSKPSSSQYELPCKRLLPIADIVTEEEYDKAVTVLQDNFKKPEILQQSAAVDELMEVTQPKRRKWIADECPSIRDVVEKFPFLSSDEWVSECYQLQRPPSLVRPDSFTVF